MKRLLCLLSMVFAMGPLLFAQLPDGLYAAFDTSMGGITCRLEYAESPLACANFTGLIEGSQRSISTNGALQSGRFYDGLIFHRVINGFMIQGGDPLGTGTGGPGYTFPDRISTNLLHTKAGILSMANSGPDSNGSQFFITLEPTPWLDGKHAVFGEVIDGMNVVSNIGAVATDANDRPLTNVVMNSVRILRVGPAAQAFDPRSEPLPNVMPLNIALTNMPAGPATTAATSNQVELALFASTNLHDWAKSAAHYFPAAAGAWTVPASTKRPREFFRGTQVAYPQTVTAFSHMAGQTFSFTQGTNVLSFSPAPGGGGSCTILGNPDTLADWADWTDGPFRGIAFFQPATYSPFYFILSVDGSCDGYQWNGFQWSAVGPFEFSTIPSPP